MPRLRLQFIPSFCLLVCMLSVAANAQLPMKEETQHAVEKLQQWYSPQSGLWQTTGWWNSANALTTIVDYSRMTHESPYGKVAEQTYAANSQKGFLNDYYDDEGWWALAWIDAYDLTGNSTYLSAAEVIFEDMSHGWDSVCRGGIYWKKDKKYKNAIANELFLSVAAHLTNRVKNSETKKKYLDYADREWAWFQQSGMINANHLINDGLDASCENNHKTEWSYNQGVILGGLAELSRIKGRGTVLKAADEMAEAAVHRLVDANGVMHDPCEPKCGADGTQFKGIFIRNLGLLNLYSPHRVYSDFITTNANSILKYDKNLDHEFGTVWSGPPEEINASTQSSALDALIASLYLHKSNPSDRRKK